jgi:hypothetical protein
MIRFLVELKKLCDRFHDDGQPRPAGEREVMAMMFIDALGKLIDEELEEHWKKKRSEL